MASACSIVMANEQSAIIGTSASAASLRTRASSCLLMTVAVICICVLVVCGVFVVREYSLAKTYEPTNCRLANVTYSSDVGCLYCSGTKDKTKDKGAGSCVNIQSPCVHISVLYQVNETFRKALLYQDSVQAIGAFSQCSYSVCTKSRDESLRMTEEYADVWRAKPHEFQCFYDTEFPDKVIASKTYSRLDVIHCMLWPSVVIIICGVIFLRLEAHRRGLTFCGSGKPVTKTRPETVKSPEEKWPPAPTTKIACNAKVSSNNECNKRQQREPDAACNATQPAANNACNNGKRSPWNKNVDRCRESREGTSERFNRLSSSMSSSMSSIEKTATLRDSNEGLSARSVPRHAGKSSAITTSTASTICKSTNIDSLKQGVRLISLKGEAQSTTLLGEML